MQLQEIYEELKRVNLCKTGYAFSRDYMCKDRSYYSVLKAKRREPSVEAWVILGISLQRLEKNCSSSHREQLQSNAQKLRTLQEVVSLVIANKCESKIR